MADRTSIGDPELVEQPVLELQSEDTPVETAEEDVLSPKDVRRNMFCCIMLDTIWFMGSTELSLALTPLVVYLKMSNTMIGLMGAFSSARLIGQFLSPWISQRFRFKKLYMIVANVPYNAAIGVAGLVIVMSGYLDVSKHWLMMFIMAMLFAYEFFAGFVSLPHQEYVAATIPTTHRGRYNGLSQGLGSAASILSASIGGWILLHYAKPMSYGVLFLLMWVACQGGYVLAAFAKEVPTPVEKAPKAWSKGMFRAAWQNIPYRRYQIYNLSTIMLTAGLGFITVYGFKVLHMPDTTSAVLMILGSVVRIPVTVLAGFLVDRVGARRLMPLWSIGMAIMFLPVIFMHSALGVYLSFSLMIMVGAMGTSVSVVLMYGLPKPEDRSGHFTLQLLATSGMNAVGILVAGVVYDAVPYHTVFIGSSILALCYYPFAKWVCAVLPADQKSFS